VKIVRLLLFLFPVAGWCQPGTDIWLFELKTVKGSLTAVNGKNITLRPGYDNQPFFHPGKTILYYSSAQDDGRTDIKEYDIKTGRFSLVTQTAEREYSPTVTPDRKFISCIIQRDNGAQDLGRYPVSGGPAEVLIDNLKVGYHAWMSPDQVLVFVLGEVMTLHVVDVHKKSDVVVAENIGRSLHRVPGKPAVSYVQKGAEPWTIRMVQSGSLLVEDFGPTLTGREDLAWLPGGEVLMSDGNKLFTRSRTSDWKEVTLQPSLVGISRLAVDRSGRYVAVVVNE
jgi:hypothetical protein